MLNFRTHRYSRPDFLAIITKIMHDLLKKFTQWEFLILKFANLTLNGSEHGYKDIN